MFRRQEQVVLQPSNRVALISAMLLVALAAASRASGQVGSPSTQPAMGSADFRPSDSQPIGWRGDGTGRYPAAQPVTQWGYWPKSPSWGLKYQLSKPKDGDAGQDAKPVVNRQLLEWLTIGPFEPKDAAKPLDETFIENESAVEPSEGDKVGDLTWTKQSWPTHNAFNNMEHDLIHLDKFAKDKPNGVGYAHAWLYAQQAGKVVFYLDHSKPLKLWVNGKAVFENAKPFTSTAAGTNYVAYAAAEHWMGELLMLGTAKGAQLVTIDLAKGWNRVMFKSGGWVLLHIVETPDVQYEGKNIRWVTKLPNWSNAMPIVVGDKIFLMTEPDYLVCVNKADGKILWKQETTWVDATPAEVRKAFPEFAELESLNDELKKTDDSDKRVEIRRKMMTLFKKVDAAAGKNNPAYKEIRKLQETLKDDKASEADKKAAVDGIRKELAALSVPREVNPLYQVIEPLEAQMVKKETKEEDRAAMSKKLQEYLSNLGPKPMFPFHPSSHVGGIGYSCPTPISDGKRVWILENGWGIAACYDLDGKLLWASLLTDMGDAGAFHNNIPVLVDGKLIALRGSVLRAFDAATGKTLWTSSDLRKEVGVDIWHGFGTGASFSSSPCAVKIGGVPFVFFNSALVRASDGKVFAQMHLEMSGNVRSTPFVLGDSIFVAGNFEMIRMPIPQEAKEGMTLSKVSHNEYVKGDIGFYSSPVVVDGLIYGMQQDGTLWVYEADTMKLVYKQKLDVEFYQDYDHPGCVASLALGGKNIYAFDSQGNSFVIAPGREFKLLAKNRIDSCAQRIFNFDADQFFQTAPVFDGKRIYVRGEQYLYCIGEE